MPSTHELEIRFLAADARVAARAKRQVLARLAALEIINFADGVVDGVDLKIESDAAVPSFDEDDGTPILVFDENPAKLATLEEDLKRLALALGFRHAILDDEAWQHAWDEGEQLIQTERFVVWPEGRAGVPPQDLVVLKLVKGEAFGSGRHATTQACLEALESLPASLPRGAVLDVGTGTGILAIAAHHLGFGPLLGTEIDDVVIAEASQNARLNAIPLTLMNTAEPPAGKRYALIVANILGPVLHHLLPKLKEQLGPGARLVLAGFIDKEAGPLLEAAARVGLIEESRKLCRGWVGLVLKLRA